MNSVFLFILFSISLFLFVCAYFSCVSHCADTGSGCAYTASQAFHHHLLMKCIVLYFHTRSFAVLHTFSHINKRGKRQRRAHNYYNCRADCMCFYVLFGRPRSLSPYHSTVFFWSSTVHPFSLYLQ